MESGISQAFVKFLEINQLFTVFVDAAEATAQADETYNESLMISGDFLTIFISYPKLLEPNTKAATSQRDLQRHLKPELVGFLWWARFRSEPLL